MKLLRILRSESLDEVALSIGSGKSRLSCAERYPAQVGERFKKKLARYYGVAFSKLAANVDPAAIADALIRRANAK